MADTRSVAIRVSGKVQGVWFRASAKSVATNLRLTGRVSNQSDGSVYLEASGSAEAIENLIEWCHKGPEFARVESIDVVDIDDPGYSTFKIDR
jgi:acylphosphatase